ncbi:Hsp33 family molecular chaperone HslO [Hydrogenovibrio sp. 3SP14C1]|uniref:Hsp33 family molecular chaperone HslO n=1 Tax=Hydrogenovibrio sp. 3SP14C1 TaxID=3038774 RepID=UPI0024166655|nr:Hsp33 family molecular chaperone HslO [Hydrogenovibrio sp. 3SP14C1]MDG4812207.1 Hsp33 family molecular chaperone HslO [Hydrogenovibrio sp. 3SP14C1]
MQDHIQRFLFKDLNIRGQHLQIDQAWQKMIAERHYTPELTKVLGELTAIAIMLANGMKHLGKVSIQVQGSGPVNLLLVEATHDLKIRGVAKTNATLTNQASLDELLGDGQILVTMENTQTQSFFQSYVPREENSIAMAFEAFLSQSEQQPSKLWLAANDAGVGGVLIQKMPTTDDHDEDGWERIHLLTDTVTDEELIELEAEPLLHRLFHEEVIELFSPEEIDYDCPQDKSKVDNMILSLGEAEAHKILEEQGEIVIHNEICNFHLRYTKEDIDHLFAEASADEEPSQTLQ